MVRTVSQLLKEIIEKEKTILGSYDLKHGPTIGDMYEGLTTKILGKALPKQLNLQVVTGFIVNSRGSMSPQMDCMVVKSIKERIPHTDAVMCHIDDVLATIEVKKTLYTADIKDAFPKLRSVLELQGEELDFMRSEGKSNPMGPLLRTFSQITGQAPPKRDTLDKFTLHQQLLYNSLVIEQFSPVRIALGYDGFSSEEALRKGFGSYLEQNIGRSGFGPNSFPDLCISGKYSLVKLNGQPYVAFGDPNWWRFYGSSHENPVIFILELLWTKLSREYRISGLWGEDMDLEVFSPFIDAQALETGGRKGWTYRAVTLTDTELDSQATSTYWEPCVIGNAEFVIFNFLCKGDVQRIDDPNLLKFIEGRGFQMEQFVDKLLATGMVALDGNTLTLTTENCVCAISPDGRYVVGENNTGRLTRWLCKLTEERRKEHDQPETTTPS